MIIYEVFMIFGYIPYIKGGFLELVYSGERTSCRNKNLIFICRLIGEICSRKKYRNKEQKIKIE